jgi:hypothetical protein
MKKVFTSLLIVISLNVACGQNNWLILEKPTVSEETGIQFRKAGNTMFYLYSDDINDGLKIQSTGVGGEGDALPRFHIPFASKDLYMVQSGGNVGIGTSAPTAKLQVQGTIMSSALSSTIDPDDGVSNNFQGYGGYWALRTSTSYSFNLDVYNYGSPLTALNIIQNGNVGIGTTAPDAKLAVKGTVHANEVKVDLNGAVAPDYVFADDYKLLTLEEIKTYIDKNKHLPEVPSAKEVEANGVQLGEMNMLLLKKIEELTLHVIELKKENEIQNKKLESLINKN